MKRLQTWFREYWLHALVTAGWYAVFTGVSFAPIPGSAIEAIRLGLLAMVLFAGIRMVFGLRALDESRVAAEHDEHEEFASKLHDLSDEASEMMELYSEAGDVDRMREWSFRAREVLIREIESHSDNLKNLRASQLARGQNAIFGLVAISSLFLAVATIVTQ
ncbi:MAG: hypothetical protein F4Z48_10080 [Dehalococcoidia bacterium]|nr:hypothetical protein [Dehalococcoidia bacterium]